MSVLSTAIALFKKDHKTDEMSAAHRIGFTFYLGEMQNATIFNSSSLEDRNVIIQMYIDKA